MQKKQTFFKTKGMNKDLSVSAFNPEFAFENINLRLSTNEGNTLMSWVNEKGTSDTGVSFDGTPIGTAVINHKLVVFTTNDRGTDKIYVIKKSGEVFSKEEVFSGNLKFQTSNPLETHVSYEADNIEKVYWTDYLSQPRVANIAKLMDSHINDTSGEVYAKFDFVTSADLNSTLTVDKRVSGGVFAPGVIQYCYTYFNKYGQQSNIINVSPINYLTHSDRGANAEDKVNNSFQITITNPDESFDRVRLYSIHRTSLDATPYILALEDFPTTNGNITYIDTGTSGAAVDPTDMLFIGGKEILAYTMEEKDQTLFLGNITQKNDDVALIQEYFDGIRSNISLDFHTGGQKHYELDNPTGILYSNTFTLKDNRRKITTFKGGDWYRFGFQLQKYTGEWTEPIYIKDVKNDKYPSTSIFSEGVDLVYAQSSNINLSIFTDDTAGNQYYIKDFTKIYKRIRPLVVYPEIQDRITLCQGVLNPTVFNVEDRKERIPYSQASWFFRPYTVNKKIEKDLDDNVLFQKDGTGIIDEDPNGHTIMLLRIKASKLGHYLEDRKIDFEAGGGSIEDEKYPYYAVLKLGTVWVKDKEDDDEDTEFCDMLFWLSKVASSTENWYFQSIRDSMSVGHPLGAPDWEATRVVAWSGYDSNNVVKYAFPNNFEPDSFCGFLKYVGNNNWGRTRVNFRYIDFRLYGDYPHVEDDYIGSYTITLYKDTLESRTPFIHYESIYTETDHEKDMIVQRTASGVTYRDYFSETGRKIKQVEVQSSVKKYLTPFDTTPEEETENSNSQFFVDQSIVTLNSADLDFDSDVQNSIPDTLNLRIIGAIPITANASAHKITTSTSMLPIDYQTEEGDDGNIREATTFGNGESDSNVYLTNKSLNAGRRLVSENMWEDSWIWVEGGKAKSTYPDAAQYLVYPWQSSRALTNDVRGNESATSVLKTKVESHLLYSYNTTYFNTYPISIRRADSSTETEKTEYNYEDVHAQVHLQENEYINNLQLPKQLQNFQGNINYYPNIDKSLVTGKQWRTYAKNYRSLENKSNPVLMRYKSGTHAVVSLPGENSIIPILPYTYNYGGSSIGKYTGTESGNTFWGDVIGGFNQDGLDISDSIERESGVYTRYDFLWLAELYKDVDESSLFGGNGEQAIKANKWLVGGDAQAIDVNSPMTLNWTEGDTFYQRYDCLKTYPFSDQDPNQLVEILSFMCESHVNLDGRYDRNRGQRDNTMMSPVNFNLINPVYNQKDNFFNYKKTNDDKVSRYPNLITFTKTKESGADIDQWTNITLASNLELDGSKGGISSIQRLNNQLFAFQDSGISQILYNESVQIASTEGVPIEIANSQKVQGKRYYSNSIGCSNKYSICNTPSGIYFIDSNDKGIYLFNGELNNLSNKFGFNTWCKTNIFSNKKWTPTLFEDFVTYYDRQNQDVLFINEDIALAFSEKLGTFTSFYDYGKAPYFCNLDDEGLWINVDNSSDSTEYKLWKHRGGNYCSFFGESKPYSTTLVGNPEPQMDKLFTNLEFRACVDGDGETVNNKYLPYLPFDSLETWNEYQHGVTNLKGKNEHNPHRHHDGVNSTLLRKFRIWRCDIPRDNIRKIDRMRNPWLYLKLLKEEDTDKKAEIHDVMMTYFD